MVDSGLKVLEILFILTQVKQVKPTYIKYVFLFS